MLILPCPVCESYQIKIDRSFGYAFEWSCYCDDCYDGLYSKVVWDRTKEDAVYYWNEYAEDYIEEQMMREEMEERESDSIETLGLQGVFNI